MGGGYCVIYCSSNDIWFPNEEYAFRKSIIENDRFEWENINSKLASKEIYIRDIYKSWYVTGINRQVDSIDKLVEFLKKEIGGLPTVLIGSSSGGFLAATLGCILHAEYVIAFSAQFELRNKWAEEVNPFLQKFEKDHDKAKYYDLKELLAQSTTPIYYIVPIKNELDLYNYKYIQGINCIHALIFNSKRHGVVVPKCCLGKLISLSNSELEKLYDAGRNKTLSPFYFSVKLVGFTSTIVCIIQMAYSKVYRKIRNNIHARRKVSSPKMEDDGNA